MFAPATVANLGPGFDILGLALDGHGDTVTARRTSGEGITIREITGDDGRLPREASKNTAGIAAAAVLKRAGISTGVELSIQKGMPIGSGLGSSAASAAAAALATNLVVGSPLRKMQLIEPCIQAEATVSGRHADNVAPSLLGGLILVRSLDPLDLMRLPVPNGVTVVVVTPSFELATHEARARLPETVDRRLMSENMANLAAFVAACYSGDLALLGRCVHDAVVNPARLPLIPGGAAAIQAAIDAGALGSSISGAGPSIFALCRSPRSAREVARAMKHAFRAEGGLDATVLLSPADCSGARRL